jgi:putative sterol carrier protein
MPFYPDSESYYANMQALFACVQTSYPKATEAIGNAKINIMMRTNGPAADIVIHGRERPVRITYGANGAKPDLQIEMAADTFHRILLGELSLKSALGNGQMKVKGPIWKAMSLGDLFHVSRLCYPDILKQSADDGQAR